MSKNRVLFFFPENPFSNRAGNTTRAKKNISILKKLNCSIDLVGFDEIYNRMGDDLNYDKNLVNDLFIIKKKPSTRYRTAAYWRYKWLKIISRNNKYNPLLNLYVKRQFEAILRGKKYDYIVINYETWSDLIRSSLADRAVKIIDTHDWMTLNEFYKDSEGSIGERFSEEINNLKKFDKVVTISAEETFVFKSFLGDKVVNIPPSLVRTEPNNAAKKWDLLFVGSENPFNIKALEYFFEEVYPKLNQHIKILIIGRIVKCVPNLPNVETIAFADDLSYYYGQSKVAICPMIQGTGIKIKVVEALSFGLPVVGTGRAIDGFSSKTNNGCLIADNPEDFKNQIVSLLENDDFYKLVQAEGRQYFDANFSEDAAIALWRSVLD